MERYFPLSNSFHRGEHKKPALQSEESKVGPWFCSTYRNDSWADQEYSELLEMHLSDSGKAVVFRVSQFDDGRISLGKCVVLTLDQAKAIRSRLDEIITHLEEKS